MRQSLHPLHTNWHGETLDVVVQTYGGFWPWRQKWETDASLRARLFAWLCGNPQPPVHRYPRWMRWRWLHAMGLL